MGNISPDAVGDACINLCGKTSLREAISLIDQCRLFITNDSGLMHVAAALNIPQIAIFGSTDHTTTSPRSHSQPHPSDARGLQSLHETGLPD